MTESIGPHEFEADSSDASKDGLLAILRSETATIAEACPDNSRFEFEIEIREKE